MTAVEAQLLDDALMLAREILDGDTTVDARRPFISTKFLESARAVLDRRAFAAAVGCDNASVGVSDWPEQ